MREWGCDLATRYSTGSTCRRGLFARARVNTRRRASRSARSHRIVPDPLSPISSNPESPIPNPLYACVYRPPAPDHHDGPHRGARGGREENDLSASSAPSAVSVVSAIAEQFSPRYECQGADLVSIDVSGLERLLGPAQTIGDELRREAAARGLGAHVAVAGAGPAAIGLPLGGAGPAAG